MTEKLPITLEKEVRDLFVNWEYEAVLKAVAKELLLLSESERVDVMALEWAEKLLRLPPDWSLGKRSV